VTGANFLFVNHGLIILYFFSFFKTKQLTIMHT